MKIEIKFRGMTIDAPHIWVYGFLMCNYDPQTKENTVCDAYIYRGLRNIENAIPVIIESVGQFTGLTDKNGREIYEGDIIQNSAAKWAVIFNKGCFCGKHLRFYTLQDGTHIALRAIRNIEVIGNIYEIPELL
jgi:uncharacterized phage protein (TIGR01671 family)